MSNKTDAEKTITRGFVSGGVVRLKTGGPCMTVLGLVNTGDTKHPRWAVQCAWFDDVGRPYRDLFPWHALEKRDTGKELERGEHARAQAAR